MLFSETNVSLLSDEQKKEVIFGKPFGTLPPPCHAVFVLGGELSEMRGRAKSAAILCKTVPVRKVIVCGGVAREFNGVQQNECDILRALLRESGVTSEIVADRWSKDTIENMLFAFTLIKNDLLENKKLNVAVVTSPWHLRRATELAKCLMPKTISVYGYHSDYETQVNAWGDSAELHARAENELRFIREAIECGFICDFEIGRREK